jgi:hypothetical protein
VLISEPASDQQGHGRRGMVNGYLTNPCPAEHRAGVCQEHDTE